jgi:hypothetical protein
MYDFYGKYTKTAVEIRQEKKKVLLTMVQTRVTRQDRKEIAQNVAQGIILPKLIHNFYHGRN